MSAELAAQSLTWQGGARRLVTGLELNVDLPSDGHAQVRE